MNNVETLTALCELNPECETLADMLTDALIEERDELPTEARRKVVDMQTRVINGRKFDQATALMALGGRYKRSAMARIREHVGGMAPGTLVVIVSGETAPTFYAGGWFDQDAGRTVEACCTVGANWLLARSAFDHCTKAKRLCRKSRVRDCRYRV